MTLLSVPAPSLPRALCSALWPSAGNRCVGDAFQDFLLSHKIKYGSGSDVIVPYIYFSLRTGKGEQGSCALILTSDVGGAAGSAATFAADAKAIGTPVEYTYSAG